MDDHEWVISTPTQSDPDAVSTPGWLEIMVVAVCTICGEIRDERLNYAVRIDLSGDCPGRHP